MSAAKKAATKPAKKAAPNKSPRPSSASRRRDKKPAPVDPETRLGWPHTEDAPRTPWRW